MSPPQKSKLEHWKKEWPKMYVLDVWEKGPCHAIYNSVIWLNHSQNQWIFPEACQVSLLK